MKNLISLASIVALSAIFMGCSLSHATIKTFVDPSIQSASVKSIAVFSLRNTSLSPGEALELDRNMTQAFVKKNSSLKILGAAEATQKLNEMGLVEDYSKFLSEFEHSGIPNTVILKKIGTALGIDAILQGRLQNVIQRDGSYPQQAAETSLTLRYTLMNVQNGNTLWEGTSAASKRKGSLAKSPPIYEVIDIAMKKMLKSLPELAK